MTDMLSPLELKLTQQIEQFLHQQNNRIQHLEDRVAQLEEERAALCTTHTVVTSQFGSTACKALYRCLDCQEPFDYFKPY